MYISAFYGIGTLLGDQDAKVGKINNVPDLRMLTF